MFRNVCKLMRTRVRVENHRLAATSASWEEPHIGPKKSLNAVNLFKDPRSKFSKILIDFINKCNRLI